MKLFFRLLSVLSAGAFSAVLSGPVQAQTGAQDYVCTFKPNSKPFRGRSPIVEFVTIKTDPENSRKILVTDAVSLAFNGAASEGRILRSDAQMTRFTWPVHVTFRSGARTNVRYNLRIRNKDGKATLTMTGDDMTGSIFGRGKCVVR